MKSFHFATFSTFIKILETNGLVMMVFDFRLNSKKEFKIKRLKSGLPLNSNAREGGAKQIFNL